MKRNSNSDRNKRSSRDLLESTTNVRQDDNDSRASNVSAESACSQGVCTVMWKPDKH